MAIAGCSTSSHSVAPVVNTTANPASVTASFVIVIPTPSTASAQRRKPDYISASTKSMTIGVGTTTVTANLSPGSPACPSPSPGSPLTCTVSVPAPPGPQTFVVQLWDQLSGTGNLLSDVTAMVTITPYANNDIGLTFNGDVASVALALPTLAPSASPIPACAATSIPVTVTAYDADKNIIVAPGNYSHPITLANSDTSGASSLSTTAINKPGDGATLNYNGGYLIGTTVSASATNAPGPNTNATFAPAPKVCTEVTDASSGSAPRGINPNTDGNLYFAEFGSHNIAHIAPTGTSVTETLETGGTGLIVNGTPQNLVTGPDGAVYVADPAHGIVQYVPSSQMQALFAPTPTPVPVGSPTPDVGPANYEPYQVANGPSGDTHLWVAFRTGNRIGEMTTAGTFTAIYKVQRTANNTFPTSLVAGPDGAIWFTESGVSKIGRITTDGTSYFEFPIATGSTPFFITTGSDGKLWFTDQGLNMIGTISTSGTVTEYPIPTGSAQPAQIVSGPDGNLYFTEAATNKIGRITTHGVFTEFPIPTASSGPYGITLGPDNNLWFTEQTAGKVGFLTI